MTDSVFTKIIKGELPCHKVYEDEHTIAFMDIYPSQEGMVVIVPKQQIPNFEDLPSELFNAVFETTHKIMRALRTIYPDKKKITAHIAGFNTPDHAHLTVFPADTGEEFLAHSPEEQAQAEELSMIAEKLRRVL